MLSAADVAERLGISYWTAIRLIKDGEIPAARIGGQFRVAEEDLATFIEANRVVASGVR